MAVDIIARGLAGRADSKAITAYEYAKRAGYTGTEEEFAEDMGNSATNATNARESAEQAQEYAEQAEQTLENKADIDGYYVNLTSGSTEQMLSDKYLEDNTAYNFRRTAGGKAVGDREIDEIIGGTLVVNQLIENGNFENASGWTPVGGTLSVADNVATFKKSQTNPSYFGKYVTIIPNHVYLGIGTLKSEYSQISLLNVNINTNYANSDVSAISDSSFKTVTFLYKTAENISNCMFAIRNVTAGGADRQVQAQKAMLIDLTQFFSSSAIADYVYNLEQTTPGAGIAWLYEYFPILNGGYIPHNTGTLQSIVLSKRKLTEFNQWNEEWFNGYWDTATGAKVADSRNVACNDFIRVAPNTKYYFQTDTIGWVNAYDFNRQFIHEIGVGAFNGEFTTPSNCYFITFYMPRAYGTAYKNDICINFSGIRNGEYEPYNSHEYALDNSKELRGVAKIDSNGKLYFDGDRYKEGVTRYFALVDLGDLNWTKHSTNYFYTDVISNVQGADIGLIANAICDSYLPVTFLNIGNKQVTAGFAIANTTKRIYMYDASKKDLSTSEFKASMSGKMLAYEISEPTTEEATPVPNPQICSPGGTEEYIDPRVEAGTIPFAIPTGHYTKYLQNLCQKLDDLPFAPSENGDYILRKSSEGTEYIPYTGDARIDNLDEAKANKNGTYEGMIVGLANNLNANIKIPLTKPYVLRSTAESEDVAGLYKRTHLTGGSLVWNQLIEHGNFDANTGWTANRFSFSVSGNKATLTALSTTASSASINRTLPITPTVGHKYLCCMTVKSSTSGEVRMALGSGVAVSTNVTADTKTPIKVIATATGSWGNTLYIRPNSDGRMVENDTCEVENVMLIDLTTAFGPTFANAIYSMNDHGLAWLYATFPELNGGYIPYSKPHFEHSKYKGVTSNGVNQLATGFAIGKQWSNGVVIDAGNSSAVVIDKYKCLPNTTYAITLPHINRTNVYAYAVFFDISGNYISTERNTLESDNHMVFTTPTNCYLFSFQVWRSGGVDFTESELADSCVVIHYDNSYDGISEPYVSWHTDLGSDVLKGIPVADDYTGSNVWSGKWHWEGDTKTPDGVITVNMSEEDAGSMNWGYVTDITTMTMNIILCSEDTPNNKVGKVSAIGYETVSRDDILTGDTKKICVNNGGTLIIYNPDFANKTREERIALITGTPILYKKRTPTTSQGTAYEENEQCHNWGIQYVEDAEYDDGNRAFKMPMGGEEVYTPNLTEKVEAMPSAPVNDGDYIVRVVNHKAEYIPLPNSFPTIPTPDGRYDLVADVSSGTVTLSWVLRS